jgi:ketosteroid isomerase-like protein
MSEENVEIVRRLDAAFRRGDWDECGLLVTDDVEFHGTVGGLTEGSVARGLPEVQQAFERDDFEAWDEIRLEPVEFIDAGDQVVTLVHEVRRGRGSGVEVTVDTAVVCELRAGRVARIQGYMDRAAALEAAGLRE